MVRISTTQPRKQRKARYNAPLHQKGRYLSAPLSPELREQYGKRRLRVATGDTVRVTRGDFVGEEGIVDGVDLDTCRILVHGVTQEKADGTEMARPVDPSNLLVTRLNLKDPRRAARLEVDE
ncbi:MAG: 50S ribosomal protein L24 [Methanomicrobiales archaeon]